MVDPLTIGVLLGVVLGAGVELVVVLGPGRYFIAKKARKENLESVEAGEWDPAIGRIVSRVVEPIKQDLANLKEEMPETPEMPNTAQDLEDLEGRLVSQLEGFESRFAEAYKSDTQALQGHIEGMAQRIKMETIGSMGLDERFFRRAMEGAEGEIEEEISIAEAAMSQNPEMVARSVAQKIQRLGSDPEWQKEHQIGAILAEIAKPIALNWVHEATYQMMGERSPGRLGTGRKEERSKGPPPGFR